MFHKRTGKLRWPRIASVWFWKWVQCFCLSIWPWALSTHPLFGQFWTLFLVLIFHPSPLSLKLWTVSSFWPPILTSKLIPLVLLVISLVFSALISMPYFVDVVSSWLINLTSSSSFPARASMSSAKHKLVIVLPPMLTEDWSFVVFQSISHDSLQEDVKKSRWKQTSLSHSNCCPKPFSYTAIVVYCAGGFAVAALYDFNQVGIDVVKFHCGPEGCMPYSIEGFLEIHKNMEEVLLKKDKE